ncbi:host cell division inhibitor Icd-like protein [Serratia fonticola]|uniref:host cell division inhibitor Icd-like protein n=1 Tax=Serratia fonticola TaxID=47917 RepID=UPI003AAAC6C5
MSSISSFGNLIPLYVDLPFLFPVAISKPMVSDGGVYTKYNMSGTKKRVDLFTHHELSLFTHLIHRCCTNSEARQWWNTNRASNHNDRVIIEVAMSDHITPLTGRNSLTPNKFTWRFLALNRHDKKAMPCRMSVEAHTEREARQVLAPHFILSFAARLPVQEVSRA